MLIFTAFVTHLILENSRQKKEIAGVSTKDFKVLFSIHVTNMLAHSVAKPFFNLLKSAKSLISTGNLGKFYRYANSKLNSKTNVGPLRLSDDSLTVDPQVKADLLSEHFGSAFAVDDGQHLLFRHACPVQNLRQLYLHS